MRWDKQLNNYFSYNPGNRPGSLYEVTANDLSTERKACSGDKSVPRSMNFPGCAEPRRVFFWVFCMFFHIHTILKGEFIETWNVSLS
jgi:hypothetical protein